VDSELHIWSRHRYYPYEYLRAALWQSYLHGASGIIIWHWSTLWQKDKKTLLEENFSKQAEALDAVCKTTMELRKFAKYAGKFSQLKGDVAILYSIPSLIKSSYITTLQKAYLSLFFLDLPVKFITEKQIKAGELDDYKLLLIPGALRVKRETYRGIKDYLKTGGNVLLSGDSLQYDQYNRPRNTFWSINKSKSTELTTMEYGQGKLYYLSFLPSAKKFSSLLDSILDKTGVERKIRVLNAGGMQNAWGVESRTVQLSNGQYLTYVLNLNKEKTKVTITGERKIGTIEDVVRGREKLGCTLSLPSMGISLLKLGYR
jgi:hypothetical protein